ncbi:GspE/PulE/PilB domain-containing protein [Anaeromyxobacter oryzae]|uniref:Type II secretion system protein GspE N-terminal domain-containing protein n=1 Tax=Anaeromyxobacter oryzae TaxID=2918170 RepID=A0ABN6MLG4_9BACT|nr:general secretion pathway protein GspE [Anaeromyxobacter oryzae]BDG01896.1 hypothetical protein AMOR_08920 [Anaeromyxobacter oryzae]
MAERLGEILVRDGACTADAVRAALKNQVIFGGRLGTNLLELGQVSEAALADALGRQHRVPSLSGELVLDPKAVPLLRADLADRLDAVPFLLVDRRLAVIAVDPSDLSMLDEVAFATGKQIHPIVAPEARIWALLKRTYGVARELRGIDVDFDTIRRAAPSAVAAPPPQAAPAGDLMGEADFDALYGKTGSFALDAPAAPSAPAAVAAAPPGEDDVIELGDEFLEPLPPTPDLIETLARGAGHAPPARLSPAAPRRDEPEPSPLRFDEALRFLEGVEERNAIARTVLRYARSKFRRAVLLTVHHGAAQGWSGLGENLGADVVRRIRIPLGAPGIVDTVVRARAHFLGPIPKTEANVRLLKQLGGGVPANALVVPILAMGRVVNVFYGDAGRGATLDASGVGELLILATRIAQSYEAMLARIR